MNVRIEKIKKHFRDHKEIYIGSAIGAVAGVVIGLVVAKKIKTTADTNHEIPEPLGSRDVPSTEHRTAAQAQPLGEAVQRDLVAPVTRAQGTESVIVCPACGSSCSIRAVNCESCGHALW